MIDTYFDRVDAANGYKSTASRPIWEDPRYYDGQLYATMIDKNVAMAKEAVKLRIAAKTGQVRYEIYRGFMRAHKKNRGLV